MDYVCLQWLSDLERRRLVTWSRSHHSLGVVRQGKIVTAAGVSSGIDMALQLVAWELEEDMSKGVQLILEYDPQPPFDSGSPKKAPALLVEQIRGMLQEFAKREPQV